MTALRDVPGCRRMVKNASKITYLRNLPERRKALGFFSAVL
jgi:hypothetical protein